MSEQFPPNPMQEYALNALKELAEENATKEKHTEEGLEKINKRQEHLANNLGDIKKEASDLVYKSLNNMDKWTFSIVTLSSAVFGFTASSMLGKDFVSCKVFLYVGVFLFVCNVVLGLWLLKEQFKNDYSGMRAQLSFLNDLIYTSALEARQEIHQSDGDSQIIEKTIAEYAVKQTELLKKMEGQAKKNDLTHKAPDVMFYVFSSGIVAILFSFLPWGNIINKMRMILNSH